MSYFYGSKILYPGLYTPDEAQRVKSTMSPDMWSLCADLCKVAEENEAPLYLVSTPEPRTAVLANAVGHPVFVCSQTLGGDMKILNWVMDVKERGKNRMVIESRNRSYLVRNIRKHIPNIQTKVEDRTYAKLVNSAIAYMRVLNHDTDSANNVSNTSVPIEQSHALLRTLFDPQFTTADIPPHLLTQMRGTYDLLSNVFTKKKSYSERLNDMFGTEKWLVMTYNYVGPYIKASDDKVSPPVCVGTLKFLPRNSAAVELSFSSYPKLYRNLDAYYETHPNTADALKTALMFTKVQRQKNPSTTDSYDTDGFLPKTMWELYDDVSAYAQCDGGMSYNNPAILVMGK